MNRITSQAIACLIIGSAFLLTSTNLFASDNVAVEVDVQQDRVPHYQELASDVGLEYGREYGYSEWVDVTSDNGLGEAGEYEVLDCSLGMQDFGMCDYGSGDDYWESMYYAGHDVTLLYQVRHDDDGTSTVELLKVEEGRQSGISES